MTNQAMTAIKATMMTGSGTRSQTRCRPTYRKFGSKRPFADTPFGRTSPVVIERPPLGISVSPESRNIMPSVAQKSVREPHNGADGQSESDGFGRIELEHDHRKAGQHEAEHGRTAHRQVETA